jgi:hypothetical protein
MSVIAPGHIRAVLAQLRRHIGVLIRQHGPAETLHGREVQCDCLGSKHGLNLVLRLEGREGRTGGNNAQGGIAARCGRQGSPPSAPRWSD